MHIIHTILSKCNCLRERLGASSRAVQYPTHGFNTTHNTHHLTHCTVQFVPVPEHIYLWVVDRAVC
jgi:hypothetical protein